MKTLIINSSPQSRSSVARTWSAVLVFFLSTWIVLSSSCSTPAAIPEKPFETRPKSFLFEVTPGKNPGQEKAFILGSIHIASADIYPLPAVIESAYDESSVLVVEADVLAIDDASIQSMFLANAMYRDGTSLEHHVSLTVHSLLQKKLKEIGIDFTMFKQWKPWAIALTLESVEYMNLGYDANMGIDIHFLKKARDIKAIKELESVAYQFDLLNSFDDKMQEMFLYSYLLEIDRIGETATTLFGAWKAGDTQKLETIVFDEWKKLPDLGPIYEKLFTERNILMADKIAGYAQEDAVHFVVVGAGHLVGKGSVIELLRANGFNVAQK